MKKLLLTTALVAMPLVAHAQIGARGTSATLEEIVVTADRVGTNLQQVPVSVTALTAEGLESRSITDLTGIDHFVPNLQYSAGPSGSSSAANFFIRGIGQVDFIGTSDPGVSVYVDGVYFGRTMGGALDTADIERIEVLRGPQGTLFGKNTIGGALNIATKKPAAEPSAFVEATVGNLGRYDGRFVGNVPLADNLFFKVSGVTRNNDGFARRRIDGVKLGDQDDVSGRAQLLWRVSDDTEVLLSADATRGRGHIAPQSAVRVVASGGSAYFQALTGVDALAFPASARPWEDNTSGVRPTDHLDVLGFSAIVDRKLNFGNFRSITAYRTLSEDTGADFDGTAAIYNDQEVRQEQDQFSQEFQLFGQTKKLKWILGAYYIDEDIDQDVDNYFYAYYAFTPYGTSVRSTSDIGSESLALFAQGTYKVTDSLGLTLGLRYTRDEKDVRITIPIDNTGRPAVATGKDTWDDVSPRIALEYQFTDDVMAYASATRGYKSGSFNGRPDRTLGFESYDPERVWTYEVGSKTEALDRRLRLNGAAFYTRYNQIQLITVQVDPAGALFFPVDNAGDVDVRGFELEMQAVPVSNLQFSAGLGYTDEKWRTLEPTALVTKQTRLPSMSHWNATLGGSYEIALSAWGALQVGANYSYRSGYFNNTINGADEHQKAYALVDAFLSFYPDGRDWSVKVWGKNLSNEHYKTWAQDLIPIGDSHATAWFGRPREYGVSFTATF